MNTLILVLVAAIVITFVLWLMVELNNIKRMVARIDACLRPSARCPVCGHPVIAAPFCDGEPYICPECGDKQVWRLSEDCRYFLVTDETCQADSSMTEGKTETYPAQNEAGFQGKDG